MQERRIYLGGGCFWQVEKHFQDQGARTRCGYANGTIEYPCYKLICTGATNHIEIVEVVLEGEFTLEYVLKEFFRIHDPTQVNRQGEDIGTQYRYR